MIGLVAVTLCAYLAAVYLAADANRKGLSDLASAFRVRGLAAGLVTGLVAAGGVFVLQQSQQAVARGGVVGVQQAQGVEVFVVEAGDEGPLSFRQRSWKPTTTAPR